MRCSNCSVVNVSTNPKCVACQTVLKNVNSNRCVYCSVVNDRPNNNCIACGALWTSAAPTYSTSNEPPPPYTSVVGGVRRLSVKSAATMPVLQATSSVLDQSRSLVQGQFINEQPSPVVTVQQTITVMLPQVGNSPSTVFRLRSCNDSNRYIRHANYLGQITPIITELDRADSGFRLVPGLEEGHGTISLESINFPGHFLRHQGYRIKLHKPDGSELFRLDASFRMIPGRAALSSQPSKLVSFQSLNYPSKYICSQNGELWIGAGADEGFNRQATFELIAQNS